MLFDRFRRYFGRKDERSEKKKEKNVKTCYTISSEVLETAIAAARESHPHEFIAMLGESKKRKNHISELIFLPSITGGVSAIIHMDMLPVGMRVLGTIHSHPSPYPYPSEQDMETFSKRGRIHIIIAYPYTMNSWRAYSSSGEPIELRVIDDSRSSEVGCRMI